jgi:hypothetical protein
MRGTVAKRLKRLAFNPPAMKYSHNRKYMVVRSPGQGKATAPRTVIADEQRYLYQTLKGRRPYNDALSELHAM